MRGTIWVLIGLVIAAGLAAWISLAVGFPTQAVLPVVFWGAIAVGVAIRLVRAIFGHKNTPLKDPIAGATESWETLYLGRHPGIAPAEPPAYTSASPSDRTAAINLDGADKRRQK